MMMTFDKHIDPTRINGLIAEDRIRTTNMFVRGNIAERPTAEIDISPEADLIQGLPTHVKITKQTRRKDGSPNLLSVDMACAHRLFTLEGTHRLLVMVYEEEKTRDANGKTITILCFTKVIEIILSPETLAAFRGKISVFEIERIRALLLQWDPYLPNLEQAEIEANKARARFHPMTEAMRERQGIAHPSVKLSIDRKQLKVENKRIQSTISINETRLQVQQEGQGILKGKYQGRILQDRYIEHTEEFHGLKLPWRTTGKWAKLKRKGAVTPKLKAPQLKVEGPFEKYIKAWIGTKNLHLAQCEIHIMRHEDEMRTLYARGPDSGRWLISYFCNHVGGTWIADVEAWLLTLEQTKQVIKALQFREVIDAERKMLRPSRTANPDAFIFDTTDGRISVIRLSAEWVLRPDERDEKRTRAINNRLSSACRFHNAGKKAFNEKRASHSWLIPRRPDVLLDEIIATTRSFDFLGPYKGRANEKTKESIPE
jgi:hypothetical protein